MVPRLVKDILNGIFILPLTAGNKNQRHQNVTREISTTIIIIIWLAVMLVLIPGKFQTKQSYDTSSPFVIHIALDSNLVLGIIGCIGIILNIAIGDVGFKVTTLRGNGVLKLRIFFLCSLLVGSLLNSSSDLWHDWLCLDQMGANQSDTWEYMNVTSNMSYNVLYGIFCALETVCLIIMIGYKLKRTAVIQFSIITTVGGNMSIWVNTLNEIYQNDKPENLNNTAMPIYEINYCYRNITDDKSIKIASVLQVAKPILQITVLQFVFLCLYTLIEKWSSLVVVGFVSISPNLSNNEFSPVEVSDTENTIDEEQELLPLEENFTFERRMDTIICSFKLPYFAISIGTLLSVVLGTMCIFGVTSIFNENKQYQYWFRKLFCIDKFILIFVFYLGFFCIRNATTNNRSYNAREIIMLVGVFFTFQYYTYNLIAVLIVDGWQLDFAIEECVDLISEYLQIVWILQLNWIEFNRIRRRDTRLLKAYVGFSMAMMLGFWFVDCFVPVGRYHVAYNVFEEGLGEDAYHLITFLIFPMFVFYRFTLFFAYANLYQTL